MTNTEKVQAIIFRRKVARQLQKQVNKEKQAIKKQIVKHVFGGKEPVTRARFALDLIKRNPGIPRNMVLRAMKKQFPHYSPQSCSTWISCAVNGLGEYKGNPLLSEESCEKGIWRLYLA